MLELAQIMRLLDIANAATQKGLVLEARVIYEKVLELMPGHAPARIGLAMGHLAVDDFQKAEDILRAVLCEKKGDPEARAALGLCLQLAGRQDEAREILAPLAEEDGPSARMAATLLAQLD